MCTGAFCCFALPELNTSRLYTVSRGHALHISKLTDLYMMMARVIWRHVQTFYRTVLGHDRFRLAFKRWNAEESIAMPDARRRRQDIAGGTAAETFPDAEIDFEVQVDPVRLHAPYRGGNVMPPTWLCKRSR